MAINYPQRYDDDFINIIKKVIDHVNEYGKTIQELVADGQLTPEQFSELIRTINGMIKSGHVSLDDLSPEVLEAINTGDGASFEVLSIPRDRSVTPQKTTFVYESTNLLDVEALEEGKALRETTGLPTDSSNNAISDFIEVEPLSDYSVKDVLQVARYDADKNFIGLSYPTDTFSTTSSTEYIRVTVRIENFNTAQINEGSELLPYEPYYFKLDDRLSGGADPRINDFLDALTEENEGWII